MLTLRSGKKRLSAAMLFVLLSFLLGFSQVFPFSLSGSRNSQTVSFSRLQRLGPAYLEEEAFLAQRQARRSELH